MKNLLVIGLMVSILGGCASRGEVNPSVSTFDPTDLSHFSYLAQLEEESSLDTEQYAATAYVETVAEAKATATVAEANDNSQKTSASFFTWNENLEQSELN